MRLSVIALSLIIFSIAMLFTRIPSPEPFRSGSKCPSSLVRSGDKLMLIYDNAPIYFDSLDEYSVFVNELRSKGIDCPVSMLEGGGDEGGLAPVLNASHDSNPGSYPGFDPQGLDIGRYTKIDAVHDSTAKSNLSDNPMDANWGGVEHTQNMVDSGKYEENQVAKQTYFTPKVQFFPDLGPEPRSFTNSRGAYKGQ